MASLTQLQEVPFESMILLVGSPGSGKSSFCEQTVLQSLAIERSIIYLTTECGPSKTETRLKERGLSEVQKGLLNFIDAYNETVGVSVPDRPDTVYADSNDISSIDIAISKLQERIGRKGTLLVFDSLTSPYLFSGAEILRFMRQTLSRFAASGNAVLACIDEDCGKSEDLVAMMSLSNGVIKMETEEGKQFLNVVKHPKLKTIRIEALLEPEPMGLEERVINPDVMARFLRGDEAVKHVLNLLEHCKVGNVTLGETVRIRDSFKSLWVKFMTTKRDEPSCYFTTGFLNGFFSTIKNQHVKETRCIAIGDPYCEWEFR